MVFFILDHKGEAGVNRFHQKSMPIPNHIPMRISSPFHPNPHSHAYPYPQYRSIMWRFMQLLCEFFLMTFCESIYLATQYTCLSWVFKSVSFVIGLPDTKRWNVKCSYCTPLSWWSWMGEDNRSVLLWQ